MYSTSPGRNTASRNGACSNNGKRSASTLPTSTCDKLPCDPIRVAEAPEPKPSSTLPVYVAKNGHALVLPAPRTQPTAAASKAVVAVLPPAVMAALAPVLAVLAPVLLLLMSFVKLGADVLVRSNRLSLSRLFLPLSAHLVCQAMEAL